MKDLHSRESSTRQLPIRVRIRASLTIGLRQIRPVTVSGCPRKAATELRGGAVNIENRIACISVELANDWLEPEKGVCVVQAG